MELSGTALCSRRPVSFYRDGEARSKKPLISRSEKKRERKKRKKGNPWPLGGFTWLTDK